MQGVEAFQKGDWVHAKELFLLAMSQNPDELETYFFLGKTCFLTDDRLHAAIFLNHFILLTNTTTQQENRAHAFDLLGQCYEADDKHEIAVTFYHQAIEHDLMCVSARHNLGLCYMKMAMNHMESHVQKCFTLLKNAHIALSSTLSICANNPMLFHSMASWQEQYIQLLKKFSEDNKIKEDICVNFMCAIHYYHEALSYCHDEDESLKSIIRVNLTECYAQFGHQLYQMEEYKKAEELYGLALQLDQNHIPALNQAGMCFFKQAMYLEARKKFSEILIPTNDLQDRADAWMNIACCHRLEKNWEEAEKSLDEARKLVPHDPSLDEEFEKLKQAKSQEVLTTTKLTLFGIQQEQDLPHHIEEFQFN